METIQRNWEALCERVATAAGRAGRVPEDITIVAVTKTRSADQVSAALQAGVTEVGENRVQEAEDKRQAVDGPARWHLIGQLQRNKAGKAVETFDVVQSVDSARLARAVDRRAAAAGRTLEALLQVNTSGAGQQGGVELDDLPALADTVASLEHLRVRGLMTIAAHDDDESVVRACFGRLRDSAEDLRSSGPSELSMEVLSMGMSGDFEWAVEEGATLIRVGTAVFGPRPTT